MLFRSNRYSYTAPVSGNYYFDTGLDFNTAVWVEVANEYGGRIKRYTSRVEAELTAGTSYLINIEYASSPRDYTVQIGIPHEIMDIGSQTAVSGSLTYKVQKDRYLYTAPADGTYLLDTGLGYSSGVFLEIGDENGTQISRKIASLTVDLKEGKTYMISVYKGEYSSSTICDYTISISTS